VSGPSTAATRLDVAIGRLLAQRGDVRPIDEDPLLATARLLRDSLPRFHPRFGFEELLARRLAESRPAAARSVGSNTEVPAEPTRLRLVVPPDDAPAAARRLRRGLLAGSAIASGVSLAIPIAGAALLAWRRGRAAAGMS